MTPYQAYRHVILPQMMRAIYAPLGNIFIGIIIGSSLAAVIGVEDLANWMFYAGNESFRYMESFLIAGVLYVVLAQVVNLGRVVTGRVLMRGPYSAEHGP
jgi:ABC-type amino acid transport system permease subunit